jgi:putative toxin-antitoxin system antitoxin component (TIGR02293 family)
VTDEYWAMVGPVETRIDQGSTAVRAILHKAEQVFGDVDKARRWLSSPSPILADTPMSLLGSRAGRRLVYDELVRIDLGDYA